MIERRKSPRNNCSISLSYRVLNDTEYPQLMEDFKAKRHRVVLFDQLDIKNKVARQKLNSLDNELTAILIDTNDQLRLLKQIVSIDFDVLYKQVDSNVTINLAGMSFQTKEVLIVGCTLEIQIKLSQEIPRLLIMSEVLRSEVAQRSGEITTVISFTFTEPEDKAILMEFVKKHAEIKGAD